MLEPLERLRRVRPPLHSASQGFQGPSALGGGQGAAPPCLSYAAALSGAAIAVSPSSVAAVA